MASKAMVRASDFTPAQYFDPQRATAALQLASEKCHLVSPGTDIQSMPEGFEVVTSVVTVDARPISEGGELYSPDRKPDNHKDKDWCISRTALNRIAVAAGINWDPGQTRRIDDQRDPHYVVFQAVATVTMFDGTRRLWCGSKTVDLRDGSVEARKMTDGQLREARIHIAQLAESKAKNRVIREMGLRSTYKLADLQNKPFVVARLAFTGRTDDPVLRQQFALMKAQQAITGASALFGAAAPAALPMAAPAPMLSAPPLGTSAATPYTPAPQATSQQPPTYNSTASSPPQQQRKRKSQPSGGSSQGSGSRWTIPGGRNKGEAIDSPEVSDRDLEYWIGRFGDDPRDAQRKEAFQAELDRRNGVVDDAEYEEGPPSDWGSAA